MTSSKRENQRNQTRQNIKESALMMFASFGLSISIAKIAEQAGITKQALMYHFPNKQDLLIAVIEDIESSSLESMLQFFSLLVQVQSIENTQKLEDTIHLFIEHNLWAVLFLRLILENEEHFLPESFRVNHMLAIKQLEKLQQKGVIKKHIDIAATFTNMNMLLLTTLATAKVDLRITKTLGISSKTWLTRRIISIFWMYRNTLFPN